MLEATAGDKRAKRILKKVPFVVAAKMRVLIFNKLLEVDKDRLVPLSDIKSLTFE